MLWHDVILLASMHSTVQAANNLSWRCSQAYIHLCRHANIKKPMLLVTGPAGTADIAHTEQLSKLLELHAALSSLAHDGKSGKARKAQDGSLQVCTGISCTQTGSKHPPPKLAKLDTEN